MDLHLVSSSKELRPGKEYLVGTLPSGDNAVVWQFVQCYRHGVLKIDGLNDKPSNLPLEQLEDDPSNDGRYLLYDDDVQCALVLELPDWVPGFNDNYQRLVQMRAQAHNR